MFKFLGAIRYAFLRLLGSRLPSIGYIGRPLFLRLHGELHLGSRVRIFPGARIEVDRHGVLCVGDNVSIGQRAHFYVGRSLVIGGGCLFAENVFISDVDHSWDTPGVPVHQQPQKQQNTKIGENCFLGYGCVILAGTNLGEGVIVGANSVVRGSFPSGAIIAGSPAKILKVRDGYTKGGGD